MRTKDAEWLEKHKITARHYVRDGFVSEHYVRDLLIQVKLDEIEQEFVALQGPEIPSNTDVMDGNYVVNVHSAIMQKESLVNRIKELQKENEELKESLRLKECMEPICLTQKDVDDVNRIFLGVPYKKTVLLSDNALNDVMKATWPAKD